MGGARGRYHASCPRGGAVRRFCPHVCVQPNRSELDTSTTSPPTPVRLSGPPSEGEEPRPAPATMLPGNSGSSNPTRTATSDLEVSPAPGGSTPEWVGTGPDSQRGPPGPLAGSRGLDQRFLQGSSGRLEAGETGSRAAGWSNLFPEEFRTRLDGPDRSGLNQSRQSRSGRTSPDTSPPCEALRRSGTIFHS